MASELAALLRALQPTPFDQVIFVGDLVDKGPDSPAVVAMVRSLAQHIPTILVEGNHEDKHRRYRRNLTVRPAIAAQQAARMAELATITRSLGAADIAFLDAAVPFHRVPEHNVLVVHGGVTGCMQSFPTSVDEARALTGKAKRELSKCLRTRYIDRATGKFLKLGDAGPNDRLWAESYDGRFGHVIFGHEPFMQGPAIYPHATGIDTGACFGGNLTALVIQASGARSFVSVPGRPFAQLRRVC
jgi:hypothetical protein